MSATADVDETIQRLRREVCALHGELTRYQLVVWTAGNVSARVPGQELLVIKPSGVAYDELTPENMVVCDLHGRVVEGEHAPSSDTEAQAYVYRELPEVGGVVHTHSTVRHGLGRARRAGALRAHDGRRRVRRRDPGRARSRSSATTPSAAASWRRCGRVAHRRCSCRTTASSRSDPTAKAAVKAAVMCEDVARTVHVARQLGDPIAVEPDGRRPALRALPERLRPALTRCLTTAPAARPTRRR